MQPIDASLPANSQTPNTLASAPDGTLARAEMMRRIDEYLTQRPALKPRYQRAKAVRRVIRKSHNYDLTSRCNLFCEGCFYFEGDDYKRAREVSDVAEWEKFFRDQAAAGVTFGFFAGAEPGLAQDRLVVAAQHIRRGSVNTNGTIRIRADIPYSIQISVWGDDDTTRHFRGGNVFWKSVRNFTGDSRARYVFTVNPQNIGQIPAVTKVMQEHGLRILFNYFSPTTSYLDKLAVHAKNDSKYFRISSTENNLTFDADSLARARDQVNEMIIRFPDAVIQNRAYNDALTTPAGLYQINPHTGVATNCNGRNFKWHQSYRADMAPSDAKCCTPNVDCSQCRLYSIALVSLIFQPERFCHSIEGFCDWIDVCDQFARVFLLDADSEWSPASEALSQPAVATSSS